MGQGPEGAFILGARSGAGRPRVSEPIQIPDWLRKAMEAQGKVDPDEVARVAADLDLDAFERPGAPKPEQTRIEE